jgi:dTDP-4-dehydrorhamnose reductase
VRLLVTGAAGMLGADVRRAAERSGHDVTALTRADLDVTDAGAVGHAVAGARPDAIVNCAAWTDVDGAERAEAAALAVNGAAPGVLARAADAAGALLIHPSTDYVFDGTARRPYVESDPTAPVGAYGRTKLAGEQAIAAATDRHLIVRTAWLYGRDGGNFVDTILRLARERDALAIVDDQIGSPTWSRELAEAIVALAEADAHGIRHVAGAGSCSWLDFAREILRREGVECELRGQTTAELGRPAPRPAWSVLASEHADAPRLPDWRSGLAGYLGERARAEVPA